MSFSALAPWLRGVFTLGIAVLAPLAGSTSVEYDVDIRWTSYGIPHVKANDYASAAYGAAIAPTLIVTPGEWRRCRRSPSGSP